MTKQFDGRLVFDRIRSKDPDTTRNMFIEGDNLDALNILQADYRDSVDFIYIDPPYNTGHRFSYDDNFGKGGKEGHREWYSMMAPRISLARELLSDDGVMFVSIDDNESATIRRLCDEVFGEENLITQFVWEKTQHFGRQRKNCYNNIEYILCYGKHVVDGVRKTLLVESQYNGLIDAPLYNDSNSMTELRFPPNTVQFRIADGTYSKTSDERYTLDSPVTVMGGRNSNELCISFNSRWSQSMVDYQLRFGTMFIVKTNKFAIRAKYPNTKKTIRAPRQLLFSNASNPAATVSRYGEKVGTSENATAYLDELMGGKYFKYPKPVSLIEYLVSLLWDPDSESFRKSGVFLDFFGGSATTAEAVMRANSKDGGDRRFIIVQRREGIGKQGESSGFNDICEIGEERIRRSGENIRNAKDGSGNRSLDIGFKVFTIE